MVGERQKGSETGANLQKSVWTTLLGILPLLLDHVTALLSDHNGRSVGVSTDNLWHDTGIGNTEADDSVDLEGWVNDGGWIAASSHLASSDWMEQVEGVALGVLDQILVRLWWMRDGLINVLTDSELIERLGVEDLSRQLETLDAGLDVIRVFEEVWIDDWLVQRIGGSQSDNSTTLWMQDDRDTRDSMWVNLAVSTWIDDSEDLGGLLGLHGDTSNEMELDIRQQVLLNLSVWGGDLERLVDGAV